MNMDYWIACCYFRDFGNVGMTSEELYNTPPTYSQLQNAVIYAERVNKRPREEVDKNLGVIIRGVK